MQKTITLVAILMLATTGSAAAGGQEGSIGVGAEFGLSGLGGPSLNYDAGAFHVGGFFAFSDDDAEGTDFAFGGRFFWHIHQTAASDFGLGAGLGFLSDDIVPADDRNLAVFLEPSLQIRTFIIPNVALSFTAGFSFGLADAEGTDLTAGGLELLGGVHYYFFK